MDSKILRTEIRRTSLPAAKAPNCDSNEQVHELPVFLDVESLSVSRSGYDERSSSGTSARELRCGYDDHLSQSLDPWMSEHPPGWLGAITFLLLVKI